MANPEHIEWLLEGVKAWNARREKNDFKPDFEGEDIVAAFVDAGIITKGQKVPLSGADFGEANLKWAILSGADLKGVNLKWVNLEWANLRGADLRGANFAGAILSGADLRRVDLTTLKLTDGDLGASANFSAVDLRLTFNLTQKQLNMAQGTSGLNSQKDEYSTQLPEDLVTPDHWPTIADQFPDDFPDGEEGAKGSDQNDPRTDSGPRGSSTDENKVTVRLVPLAIHNASFLEHLSQFREKIRGDNQLDEEFRKELLSFIDSAHSLIIDLHQQIQSPETSGPDKSWAEEFKKLATEELGKYIAPENAAKASVPLGVISGFTVTGALLGAAFGTPMVGAGIGGYVGNLITNQVKPKQAIDGIKDQFDSDQSNEP